MKFQFESFADFMMMNGHGPYVWASYLITFVAIVYLLCAPVVMQRAFIKKQRKQLKLAQLQASKHTA